ncbi:glutathione S-transferase T3-like [Apium graveolens]|uniref:glutathione S-transferase T3-like n=1 Tax=Apium graveolens TaxID=4045 RepID=UPI003D792CC3
MCLRNKKKPSALEFPFPPVSNSQFETQQTPINFQNSPETQVPALGHENVIDLNDDCEETEEVREITGQWKWVEDKLLISAWLNVSIDPLIERSCGNEKRWQRINEGAKKFGSCYVEAQRNIGNGSNLDNIIEDAHARHLKYYKKKSNFEGHWREFRKHPKWRKPAISASSKKTKLSSSGAYSSEGNNDTPTSDDCEPVRPKGTKTAKRKRKGKTTAAEVEEYESLQVNDLRKMNIMDTINDDATNGLSQPNICEEPSMPYETYIQNSMQMCDKRAHHQLQNDFVEHISQFHENR